MIFANITIPSTGHPFLDAVLVVSSLIGLVWAALRDGAIKGLRRQLSDVSDLLEKTSAELDNSRELNSDLRRRLHERDIEIAQMQGRTDFEPVRMMLKELISTNAITSTNQQIMNERLTESVRASSEIARALNDLIHEMRKPTGDNKLA